MVLSTHSAGSASLAEDVLSTDAPRQVGVGVPVVDGDDLGRDGVHRGRHFTYQRVISPLREAHVVLLRQSPVVDHLLNVCQALLGVGFQHRKTVFDGIQKWRVSGQKPDFPLCVWILDCPVAWRVVEQEDGSFVAEDGDETGDETHHVVMLYAALEIL